MSNFRAIAEISEGAYFAFTNTIKTRTIDWSSDGYIRETVEKITSLETAKKEKGRQKKQGSKRLWQKFSPKISNFCKHNFRFLNYSKIWQF